MTVNYGLIVFVLVCFVNVLALEVDYLLEVHQVTTITDLVKMFPYLGVPIILWQVVGALGLIWHFYLR